MCNLEKWYKAHLQGRSRDADVENGHVDMGVEGEAWMNWEISIDISTLPCIKQITSRNLLYSIESLAQYSVARKVIYVYT